ncbi:MAG TPA: response regulator [Verrucomicrobiota bacterium]|nr:response regulator [Verrucomicrobiota bacterium]HNT14791.1 response regulator [Verrucomicrobiota bacterium]
MARLTVISKAQEGLACELGPHWVTIGRAETNSFQIPEVSISGEHCEVLLRGEELVVRDMRSTNGTFINNKLVTEGILKSGETLRLGDIELQLEKSPGAPGAPVIASKTELLKLPKSGDPFTRSEDRSAKPRQVLLVDDSMAFLETLGEMFEVLSDKSWQIYRACAADQALALLQQHSIDLVVLDINMPMLDGAQLLAVIHRRHPDVKKVILTGHANDSHRSACLANGAELFLEKPITPDGFVSVFNLLNDLFVWSQREGFTGTLRQVGLTDVIQIECLRRNSTILEILSPGIRGEIYIEAGAIVHAAAGALSGEKALFRLLAISNGQFRVQPFHQPPERTIKGSWEYLLMEAARLRDETASFENDQGNTVRLTKAEAGKSAGSSAPSQAPDNPPKTAVEKSAAEQIMAAAHDGKWHPVEAKKKKI